ncbi:MAG: type II toxin-antitoxin system HicA family toxin [Chloroflexi bacterium]|nr:type II toxin-antitoxin system HicA family toxin [Chloroflexota bacterium]MBI4507301.1 type II toxin-antitoxin system HicA family toxin [Chloroflexota bacterium]
MTSFPADAPLRRVVRTLEALGFHVVRLGPHIALVRDNPDGTRTPLTLPNHRRLKGSTLRTICAQAGISREAFLAAYARSEAALLLAPGAATLPGLTAPQEA